jgi:hypothetical protein
MASTGSIDAKTLGSKKEKERLTALAWALYLQAQGIQHVAWDFDGTIMASFALAGGIQYKTRDEFETLCQSWSKSVSPDFRYLFPALQHVGISQSIVTHNGNPTVPQLGFSKGVEMIRNILKFVIGEDHSRKLVIIAVHTTDKLYHLAMVQKVFHILKNHWVLLVDDMRFNIDTANTKGYSTWHVNTLVSKGNPRGFLFA